MLVLPPIQIVSGNIGIFKRSAAEGGEKRPTIFHKRPGDARKDEEARERVGDRGPQKFRTICHRPLGNRIPDLCNDNSEQRTGKCSTAKNRSVLSFMAAAKLVKAVRMIGLMA